MTETLRDLLDRAQRDGMTKGLVYHIARVCHEGHPERIRVCVRCGWTWMPYSNRCVNPECNGFCTWGERQHAEPDSWVKLPGGGYRPRVVGEEK